MLESTQELNVRVAAELLNILFHSGTTEQRVVACIEAVRHIHRIGEMLESTQELNVRVATKLLNMLLLDGTTEQRVVACTETIPSHPQDRRNT
jgi:hypothetical protein